MSYKVRDGIVMTKVCDEYLLVAARRARGFCPYVKRLNSSGGYFWSLLEQGLELDEMAEQAAAFYHAPKELIRRDLKTFLDGLAQQNYIIPEDEA